MASAPPARGLGTILLSGERTSYDSDAWAPTAAQHKAAYRFVAQYAAGRNVVEIGCGNGFGAVMIAEVASQVVAIDNSSETIRANERRSHPPNLSYRVGDAALLSPDEIHCDLLVALQVIEHIPDAEGFVRLLAGATRPSGMSIVATPNRLLSVGENPYHVREYLPAEFQALLSHDFAPVALWGVCGSERALAYHSRRRTMARSLLSLDVLRLRRVLPRWATSRAADILGTAIKRYLHRRRPELPESWDDEYSITAERLPDALDLIAVCGHSRSHAE